MNDEQYLTHCRELLAEFATSLAQRCAHLPEADPLRELSQSFEDLTQGQDPYSLGPVLVARLFTTYPELAPSLPRQLLWFFGGDCLHYMPEEEIDRFQQLDDMRRDAAARGELFNLREARANLLNLQ